MSKKMGNTNARHDAAVQDCISKIAVENIANKDWCEYAMDEYKITKRQCQNIWKKAWEGIRERYSQDAVDNLNQALLRLDDLYINATKQGGDWNTRANILRERHKLLGLGVERHEHKVDQKLSFDFESDDSEEN